MFECKIGRETLYFSIENAPGEPDKEPRLRGGLRTDGFMVGSWSDHGRIVPALEMTFDPFWKFSMKCCSVIFRGRRSIW